MGKMYHDCTTENDNKPWCSLTSDYDKNQKYGYCGRLSNSPEYTLNLTIIGMCNPRYDFLDDFSGQEQGVNLPD